MALNGNRLGDAIKAAIDAVSDKNDRTALFRAIGNAIVQEIETNALVNVTGVAGGAGTATGTIS